MLITGVVKYTSQWCKNKKIKQLKTGMYYYAD